METTVFLNRDTLRGLVAASRGPAFPMEEHLSFGDKQAVVVAAKGEREGLFYTWVALFGPRGKEVLLHEEGSMEDYLLGLQRVRLHPSLSPSREEVERSLGVLEEFLYFRGGKPFLLPSVENALIRAWEKRGIPQAMIREFRFLWEEGATLQLTFPDGLLLLGRKEGGETSLVDALLALTPHLPLSLYSMGAHVHREGERWVSEWMEEAMF